MSLRPVVLGLFFVLIVLSIAATRWMLAGLPIRTFVALGLLGLLIANDPALIGRAVRSHPRAVVLIALFAGLGIVVSLVNGLAWPDIGRQLLEIHLQAIVGLLVASGVIRLCGVTPMVGAIVAGVLISAIVALAQFVGFEPGWAARRFVGVLQNDSAITQIAYMRRERPMGLSISPVHLATQACLGFAAIFMLLNRDRNVLNKLQWQVVAAVIVTVVTCVVSGNRSPLLGVIAFGFAYLWMVNRHLFFVALGMGVLAVPMFAVIQEALQAMGLRVAQTDDGSAMGRGVLANLGLRLFLSQPFGYGLGFDSTQYWAEYWDYLKYAPNADAVRSYTLHNYFLLILNKYGVGAIAALALLIPRSHADRLTAVAFLPYFFHIAFHNDGPFQADFLFWYVIAIGAVLNSQSARGYQLSVSSESGARI